MIYESKTRKFRNRPRAFCVVRIFRTGSETKNLFWLLRVATFSGIIRWNRYKITSFSIIYSYSIFFVKCHGLKPCFRIEREQKQALLTSFCHRNVKSERQLYIICVVSFDLHVFLVKNR